LAAGNWENVCILKVGRPRIKMLTFIRKQEEAWKARESCKSLKEVVSCWSVIQDNFLLLFSVAWKAGAQALNA